MSNQEANCTCNCAVHEQDKKALLAKVIESYRDKEGSLIMVLHAAQDLYGYLPEDVLKYIADELGLSYSYVSGVVSFLLVLLHGGARQAHHPRVHGHRLLCRGGKLVVEAAGGKARRAGRRHDPTTRSSRLKSHAVSAPVGSPPPSWSTIRSIMYVTPENVDDILAEY